ncbi:stalk domain-containing protein [Paenibacillus riograndensis]|nr:stalk domain-containing protein [Paenibacillus riograndensis]
MASAGVALQFQARFVSEALKATVKWEPESQSVVIYEE